MLAGAEAEVLVIAAGLALVVEIDVKEFSGVEGLGDVVGEVEAGHGFVGDFGIDADEFGVVEGFDEGQHVAGGGQVNVAAGFVGFGFEGEAVVVIVVHGVFAHEVEGIAEAFEGVGGVFAGVGFGALAAAPEDEGLGAEFGAEVHGGHGFLEGVGADAGIAGGGGAVFEDGVREEVAGGHGDGEVVVFEGFFEVLEDAGALGGGGVDRHEVIVVEVDAVGADFGEEFDDLDGGELAADGAAEGIAADVADGPESEGEFFVFGGGEFGHGWFLCE